MTIHILQKNLDENEFDVVERKGVGHPDTLADALAERLSSAYSQYTLTKFGAVLHHNFDKVGLLGGASYVTFGKGYLTAPIRVLINGRASVSFAGEPIPLHELLTRWVKEFFNVNLPLVNTERDIDIHFNLSSESSPGKTDEYKAAQGTRQYWFEPRSLDDIGELRHLVANDTSLGVGSAPRSDLEKIVLEIERSLTSPEVRLRYPWMGTDVKILAHRIKTRFLITMCIPQIANYVPDIEAYKRNLEIARGIVLDTLVQHGKSNGDSELSINTRDNFDVNELYLTATGSSIESGDEGLVGRGNRIHRLITPLRPMSMEGASGKNPVYHIGKLYYITAQKISDEIFSILGLRNEVYLSSQSGHDLLEPWIAVVQVNQNLSLVQNKEVVQIVTTNLHRIPTLSIEIIHDGTVLS